MSVRYLRIINATQVLYQNRLLCDGDSESAERLLKILGVLTDTHARPPITLTASVEPFDVRVSPKPALLSSGSHTDPAADPSCRVGTQCIRNVRRAYFASGRIGRKSSYLASD